MTRIAVLAMLVAVAVLVIAGPSQAESAFELGAAERTITARPAPVSVSIPGVSIPPAQVLPGWLKGVEDRDVR